MTDDLSAEDYVRMMSPVAGIEVDEQWVASVAAHVANAKRLFDVIEQADIDKHSHD